MMPSARTVISMGLDMVTVAFGLIYNSKMYADAKCQARHDAR